MPTSPSPDRSVARYTCYAQRNGPDSGSWITCPLRLGAKNWTCEVIRARPQAVEVGCGDKTGAAAWSSTPNPCKEQRGLAHSKTCGRTRASMKRYASWSAAALCRFGLNRAEQRQAEMAEKNERKRKRCGFKRKRNGISRRSRESIFRRPAPHGYVSLVSSLRLQASQRSDRVPPS
jgi:hypothetical protein